MAAEWCMTCKRYRRLISLLFAKREPITLLSLMESGGTTVRLAAGGDGKFYRGHARTHANCINNNNWHTCGAAQQQQER